MSNAITLKVYDSGKLKASRAFWSERIRIGSSGADLLLEAKGVEASHAVIERGPLGHVLRALGSAQVLLNGQPIIAAPLRHGDLISVGELRVMVELARPGQQAPPPPASLSASDKRPKLQLQLIRGEEPSEAPHHHHPSLAVVRDTVPSLDEWAEEKAELACVEDEPSKESHAAVPAQEVGFKSEATAHALVLAPEPAGPPELNHGRGTPERASEQAFFARLPKPSPEPVAKLPPLPAGSLLGGEAAEAELFWGDTRLSVWQLSPGQELVAGTSDGCDALLEGVERATVVKSDVNGWIITAPRPLSLSLIEGGRTLGGSELLVRGRSQADARGLVVPLPQRAVAILTSGKLSLRVRRVPSVARAGAEPADWKGVLIASIAAVLLVAAMRVAAHAVPQQPRREAELISPRPMMVRASIKTPDPLAAARPQPQAQARRDPGKAVARHLGTEGQAGSKNAPRRDARAERAHDDKAAVADAGLLKALGGHKGVSDVFGAALDHGTRDALGHLDGPRVADARGDGALGLKSLGGAGGGGDGSGLGLSRIGTNGIGGGVANYGEGKGGLKGKESGEIDLGPSTPQVVGRIDPELIRKVVHEHRAQIRTCYETQLTSHPDLAGKVVAAWTIDQSGAVTEAHTQESNLKDHAVESCVSAKIRTWRFPIPKGGGEVFVTYPFIFTPGG